VTSDQAPTAVEPQPGIKGALDKIKKFDVRKFEVVFPHLNSHFAKGKFSPLLLNPSLEKRGEGEISAPTMQK
jgi:hypothetical protein